MQPNHSLQQQAYAQAVGTTPTNYPVISKVDPTSNDTNYNIGRFWINTVNQDVFYLKGLSSATSVSNPYGQMQAIWVNITQSSQLSFVTDSGSAIAVSDIINVLGTNGVTTSSTGNTITVTGTSTSGLWVPNIQIGGSSAGITYTTQNGGYIVISNVVTIYANVQISNKGINTGTVTISNLPVASGVNGTNQALSINQFTGWTLANYSSMTLSLANSSTVANFAASGSGQAIAIITDTQISNSFGVKFTASYLLT